MPSKTECKRCTWATDCVNVGRFEDNDCLVFSGQVRTPEPIKPQPKVNPRYSSTERSRAMIDMLFDNRHESEE